MLQSDDWGRVGLRDHEGYEQLRSAGLELGERPYDLYTLETAEDVHALRSLLSRHRDRTGRSAVMVMNFLTANLDVQTSQAMARLNFVPLAEGLPHGWIRPGLFEAYREGIANHTFYPALHGVSHFFPAAVERMISDTGPRGQILRTLWAARTPYIYWRMPWIGYEYWDPEQPPHKRFLTAAGQSKNIRQAVSLFAKMFGTTPRSACAPGYRANQGTFVAWSDCGVRCVQNGPGRITSPHLDANGMLHLSRTVELEPATDDGVSVDAAVQKAESCFAVGAPAIVSIHSINFHSTVRDFRTGTLQLLDQFLSALKAKHPNLLYVHDEDLYDLVQAGSYDSVNERIAVEVKKLRSRPFPI